MRLYFWNVLFLWRFQCLMEEKMQAYSLCFMNKDPSTLADRSSKLLFSSQKAKKHPYYYKQVEPMLVKIDVYCLIQGNIVIECVHLDDDLVREHVIFKAMFNTGFVQSESLTFSCDEVDEEIEMFMFLCLKFAGIH